MTIDNSTSSWMIFLRMITGSNYLSGCKSLFKEFAVASHSFVVYIHKQFRGIIVSILSRVFLLLQSFLCQCNSFEIPLSQHSRSNHQRSFQCLIDTWKYSINYKCLVKNPLKEAAILVFFRLSQAIACVQIWLRAYISLAFFSIESHT